jgi:peptide/nickel transport system permease protein
VRRVAWKLVSLVGVLFIVSVLTFSLTKLLPGDPVQQILGPQASNEEAYNAVSEDLGLDKPVIEQYKSWVSGVLHGDFGRSYKNNQDVSELIGERLPATIELLVLAQFVALAVAVPLGVLSAYKQNTGTDRAITSGSFALLAIPNFALAVLLIYIFAVKLDWVPVEGYTPISQNLGENLKSITLPVLSLSAGLIAVYTRLLRTDMIATLQEDFILMARAKGLRPWRILLRHALRPSSFTLLTVIAINIGALIGGSVIIEYLFSLPGMGSLLIGSIFQREYLVVQGVVLLIAAAYVIANFVVDMLYTVLDPRIRHAAEA